MARAGPLGQEAALKVSVYQALLHLGVHRRIHDVEEGEKAAEGVPEASVGKHIARLHLAIIGAVVYHFALSVVLEERAGE